MMWTFDKFVEQRTVGSVDIVFDECLLENWCGVFPADRTISPLMPPGMTAVVVIRSYMQLLENRPKGNLHASQQFAIIRLPILGDCLSTEIRCESKEIANGRRWVRFAADTRVKGDSAFTGKIVMLWAA
jgi:hypothetical protein